MQIVVRQISGLGNQLFQYAAGRYYAKRHGATMRMAIDPLQSAVSHGYPRPFLLPHFQISQRFEEVTALDRFIFTHRPLLKPAAHLWMKTLGIGIVNEPPSRRYSFLRELAIDGRAKTVYLVGYWQTFRLVDAVAGELRAELSFREAARGRDLEVLKQIEGSREPVSLHIRRGDYTLAAEGNRALPVDYYVEAIRRFRERLRNPTFFVFSDDMRFARAHLPGDAPMVFVDHNSAATSYEDLRLMSACRHHILANSTFSWWGAWLNARPDKIVVAPRHWLLTRDSYFPDLLPPEWTLLDTEVGA